MASGLFLPRAASKDKAGILLLPDRDALRRALELSLREVEQ